MSRRFASLTVGAFLLAMWCDARLARRRPATTCGGIAHVAASCILIQLATIGAGVLAPEGADATARVAAICGLILPALTYAFVAVLWLLRTLAETGLARR